MARETSPHLVTIDLDTVDGAMAQALPSLRLLSPAPIVALPMEKADEDVIAGFDSGADDYVIKPFNMEVLVTRVKAVLRRALLVTRQERQVSPRAATTYRIRAAVFDVALNRIVCDVLCINLTPTQSRILHLLFVNEGQAVSPERITKHIGGEGSDNNAGVIRTHIRHLREIIARLPDHPQPILTLPGFGYMARQIDDEW